MLASLRRAPLLASLVAIVGLAGGVAFGGCGGSSRVASGDASVGGNDGTTLEASIDASAPPPDSGTTADAEATTDASPDVGFDAPPVAAAPTFVPQPGTYVSGQIVTITTTTPDATIYYTSDGTNPTTDSGVYTMPLDAGATVEFRAMTTAPGYSPSEVASALYVINIPCGGPSPPFATPPSGVENNDFLAVLTSSSNPPGGSVLCYTLDGSTPAFSAGLTCVGPTTLTYDYDAGGGIPIDGTVTGSPQPGMVVLNAIVGSDCGEGDMAPVTYTLMVATPSIAPPSGAIDVGTTVTFTTATTGAVTFHYTTDGTPATCSSTSTGAAFVATGTETSVSVVGCKPGYVASASASASYTF